MSLPALVAHADWSAHPAKRWMARAVLQPGGRYLVLPPVRVGALDGFWPRLEAAAAAGPILVGFDFPIGLPAAYADRVGIEDFREALDGFDGNFYHVARTAREISLARPFYPDRPGGRSRRDLVDALGLEAWDRLHRRCDRATASRPAACPMFWTLGGNQVGKAAITGWRELLAPARRGGIDVAIWPFDGSLAALLRTRRFVVAETYPGEVYEHLGLRPALRSRGGKRRQAARAACAALLLAWAERSQVVLAPALADEIEAGFGPHPGADDRFDAVIGVCGMLNVLRGARPSGEPDDPTVLRIEGWILGQPSGSDVAAAAAVARA
jgi:Protein of unknown function (DUF429)